MTADLRPKFAHTRLNYDILGSPDVLRTLVDQGQTDAQIAVAAGCCADSVQRWRMLYGIKRPNWKVAAKLRKQKRIGPEEFNRAVARVYAKRGRCWPQCPGWEQCLDDDRPCMYTDGVR